MRSTVSAFTAARAQSVHWEAVEDSSDLQLVFEDCKPDGDPKLPPVEDSVLTLTGTSSQINISLGASSQTTILTYNSRARRAGVTLHIPAFVVKTTKGPREVAAFTGGAPRVIPDSTVNSRLMPGAATVWAGEVFSLTYTLDAARRSFNHLVVHGQQALQDGKGDGSVRLFLPECLGGPVQAPYSLIRAVAVVGVQGLGQIPRH